MDRREYKRISSILRGNGSYALRWLSLQQLGVWDRLITIQDSRDYLADRQRVVEYCIRENIDYNFRQLAQY
jgi:hypothetical protein